jgi:hypothetical protein
MGSCFGGDLLKVRRAENFARDGLFYSSTSGETVAEMSLAIRFRHRFDGMMAQGQRLLHSFRQLLKGTNSRSRTLTFLAAGVRRRAQAVMPHAKRAVGALSGLLSHFRRRKTLAIATG